MAWGPISVGGSVSGYTLPTATASVLGGVKTGSNITNSGGTISITKANVTEALGYTPPTTNTTYGAATKSAAGLMSAADKKKLDNVAAGANAYSLPTATASVLGGVKTGSNITNSGGTISITKANVTEALGYTPPTANTWRGIQNNLTSTATDQSLSANQGKVLKGIVDGKANASHTHNYAGSGSAGGTANSVNGLTFAAQTTDPGVGSSLATNKVLIVYV